MKEICALILAAGEGKRIGASQMGLPKVMFPLSGKPMVSYLIDSIMHSGVDDLFLVVGFKREKIKEYFKDTVNYIVQEEQRGTGHAAMMAKEAIDGKYQNIIVCYGDNPLISPSTVKDLINLFNREQPIVALITAEIDNPSDYGYGRIIRNQKGKLTAITEQKDCSEEQLKIKEWNPGFYLFDTGWLFANINKLKNDNKQREYYLTDMIALAINQDQKINTLLSKDHREMIGINNQDNLKVAEEYLAARAK